MNFSGTGSFQGDHHILPLDVRPITDGDLLAVRLRPDVPLRAVSDDLARLSAPVASLGANVLRSIENSSRLAESSSHKALAKIASAALSSESEGLPAGPVQASELIRRSAIVTLGADASAWSAPAAGSSPVLSSASDVRRQTLASLSSSDGHAALSAWMKQRGLGVAEVSGLSGVPRAAVEAKLRPPHQTPISQRPEGVLLQSAEDLLARLVQFGAGAAQSFSSFCASSGRPIVPQELGGYLQSAMGQAYREATVVIGVPLARVSDVLETWRAQGQIASGSTGASAASSTDAGNAPSTGYFAKTWAVHLASAAANTALPQAGPETNGASVAISAATYCVLEAAGALSQAPSSPFFALPRPDMVLTSSIAGDLLVDVRQRAFDASALRLVAIVAPASTSSRLAANLTAGIDTTRRLAALIDEDAAMEGWYALGGPAAAAASSFARSSLGAVGTSAASGPAAEESSFDHDLGISTPVDPAPQSAASHSAAYPIAFDAWSSAVLSQGGEAGGSVRRWVLEPPCSRDLCLGVNSSLSGSNAPLEPSVVAYLGAVMWGAVQQLQAQAHSQASHAVRTQALATALGALDQSSDASAVQQRLRGSAVDYEQTSQSRYSELRSALALFSSLPNGAPRELELSSSVYLSHALWRAIFPGAPTGQQYNRQRFPAQPAESYTPMPLDRDSVSYSLGHLMVPPPQGAGGIASSGWAVSAPGDERGFMAYDAVLQKVLGTFQRQL